MSSMAPELYILGAWLLFGGMHLLMSASRLREWLSPQLGPAGFTLLFSAVTTLTLGALIIAVTLYGDQGQAGLNLDRFPIARWSLGILGLAGAVLAVAGLINYPQSPMAALAQRQREKAKARGALKPPTAVEQISRHPFFSGLAILMSVHTLFADTLASAIYFAGFVVISLIGIPMQDRKLRARWADVYSDYEKKTSALPFGGKEESTKLPSKRGWVVWAIAVAIALLLLGGLHPVWAYANGAPFAGFILVFGLVGVLSALFARH